MASRRHVLVAAVLLGCLAVTSFAAPSCKTIVSGYSPLFGSAHVKAAARYQDQLPAWKAGGDISGLRLYYSSTYGCVLGLEPSYGRKAALLGSDDNVGGLELALRKGEFFEHAEYKAGGRCLEYLKLTTNQGRELAVGNAASATMTSTVTVNRMGGYLGALRGWSGPEGHLEQVQLVWALTECDGTVVPPQRMVVTADGDAAAAASDDHHVVEEPAHEEPAAAPAAEPVAPAADEVPAHEEPAAPAAAAGVAEPEVVPESAPADDAAAQELAAPVDAAAEDVPAVPVPNAAEEEPAAAATTTPAAVAASGAVKEVCPPKRDLCDASAASGASNFCRAAKPFESSKCIGGCCVSSGKCKFGSCAANGLGKDAPVGCFGTNHLPNALSMLQNKCANLACKLAVPGCKTSLIGGACVGTVVAANATAKLHAQGEQYIGHPCVETVPTGGIVPVPTLINFGLPKGEFVAAGWKICDCVDAASLPKPAAPGFHLPKLPPLPKLPSLGKKNASDEEMAGPSKFALMRDMVMGSLMPQSQKDDPFSDFMGGGDDAAGAAPAAADGAAAADAAAVDATAAADGAAAAEAAAPAADGAAVQEAFTPPPPEVVPESAKEVVDAGTVEVASPGDEVIHAAPVVPAEEEPAAEHAAEPQPQQQQVQQQQVKQQQQQQVQQHEAEPKKPAAEAADLPEFGPDGERIEYSIEDPEGVPVEAAPLTAEEEAAQE